MGGRCGEGIPSLTLVAPTLEPADLVALDRVVCRYGDMASLLTAASALARRRLALVCATL